MHQAPNVAVIILNWNDGAATLSCLEALRAIDYPNYRIIVVDNGSTDGSVQRIRDFGGVDLVINPTNLGYTGGVNVGIETALAAAADYVWLLNSDAITQPDTLSKLVAAAESDDRVGLISPVFHDPDRPEVTEFCLGRFDPNARTTNQTDDPATAIAWQNKHPNQVVLVGTALLIRRRVIETIGKLDPIFFAYVEDIDYSLRSDAAGFRNIVVPQAVVFHKFKQPVANPGGVPPYLHYFMTRNYLLLWRKLPRPRLMRKATLWFLHQRLTQIHRMRGQNEAIDAVLAGFWDGLRGIGGPYDPTRPSPWLLRVLFARFPGLWLSALDGWSPVYRKAL